VLQGSGLDLDLAAVDPGRAGHRRQLVLGPILGRIQFRPKHFRFGRIFSAVNFNSSAENVLIFSDAKFYFATPSHLHNILDPTVSYKMPQSISLISINIER
jgi:hypothetical protein